LKKCKGGNGKSIIGALADEVRKYELVFIFVVFLFFWNEKGKRNIKLV